ncbi:hypothetical protein P3S67_021176 [Capsicum chacoense]
MCAFKMNIYFVIFRLLWHIFSFLHTFFWNSLLCSSLFLMLPITVFRCISRKACQHDIKQESLLSLLPRASGVKESASEKLTEGLVKFSAGVAIQVILWYRRVDALDESYFNFP